MTLTFFFTAPTNERLVRKRNIGSDSDKLDVAQPNLAVISWKGQKMVSDVRLRCLRKKKFSSVRLALDELYQ